MSELARVSADIIQKKMIIFNGISLLRRI